MTPRLKELYKTKVVSQLEKELGVSNVNQVPRLQKIVAVSYTHLTLPTTERV